MSFPFTQNTAVDIYRSFNPNNPLGVTLGSPAVQGARGFLKHYMEAGRFGFNQSIFWTNLLYLPLGTDIRSAYNSFLNPVNPANSDTVVIADYPIANVTTAFQAVMVQLASRGADAFLRVYLDKAGTAVVRSCCDNISNQLHVTMSEFGGPFFCPCIHGTTFQINLNTQNGRYEAPFSACGHSTNFFQLWCADPNAGLTGWAMQMQCNGSTPIPGVLTANSYCDPFHLNFVFPGVHPWGDCCTLGGATNVDITL